MNYKIIIATGGFAALLLVGVLLIVGTLLKWKPLIDPKEKQWLFSIPYIDRKYMGKSWVITHNFVMGLILILISLAGLLIALHKWQR